MVGTLLTNEHITAALEARGFVATGEIATALLLSAKLGKPLLIEGPPGVGKTEIGKLWAEIHQAELIRLQCYEGLDEAKALYEWSYGKQMLYAQLLRDKTAEVLGEVNDLRSAVAALSGQADAFFSREFLLPRPLLAAITATGPVVLLIDEIDRADEEFEAFLLEVLSDYQVSIPELGTLRGQQAPRVILTSNDSRELSDALRRRCLYHYIDYPSAEEELRIVTARVPGLDAELRTAVVRFVQSARKQALRKPPGISETIDWALSLATIGADALTDVNLRRTLGALLKGRDDIDLALRELGRRRA